MDGSYIATGTRDGRRYRSSRPCHPFEARAMADVMVAKGYENVEVLHESEYAQLKTQAKNDEALPS